jgi:hypothetical protein
MRVSIHATIENENGSSSQAIQVGEITREAGVDPASGLGLFVREANALLQQIQSVVLNEQADEFIRVAAGCLACGRRLGIKDTKSLVYRTVYGKALLRSPRFYSRCSACGFRSGDGDTVSPLAHALKDRSHPQWTWFQCRYASVMSYRLAKIYLRDAFPGGKDLPASSIKRNVGAIGQRLEREVKQATGEAAYSFRRANRLPLTGPPLALQIDAGYIKTRPQADGKRWIPVVASKLVRSSRARGYAHASALGLGRRQGMRQQAFLQSIGVDRQSPVTVLSDGGDDISHACKLPAATTRVLDWFHIGMRFEQLLLSLRGLRGADAYTKHRLQGDVIAAKWLLWNGRKERCFEALEALRRETGWVGARNPLGSLIRYLRGCSALLVNYARRRALNLPVSSAGAESVVDYLIGQRLKRNGHMLWTREGANSLLQVRCAVLNGLDVRNFKRWYPPGKQFAPLPRARLLS